MSESVIDKKIEWLEAVDQDFNAGRPEPAWDQAGEILDLCLMALRVVRRHPDALRELQEQWVATYG